MINISFFSINKDIRNLLNYTFNIITIFKKNF